MLRMLLKYDFKAVFKFWWIAALSSFVLALAGGGCITVIRVERDLPVIVDMSAGMVIFASIFGLFVFTILTTVLVFIRFYKNLFTDEGYLTFTLPVKISSILNSKLIMSVGTALATSLVVIINVFTMLAIGLRDEMFSQESIAEFFSFIKEIVNELGFFLPLYIIEGILITVLTVLFSHLFLCCCITLASVITKKARVITAIGIYYGVNMVVSFIMQMLMLFGLPGLFERFGELEAEQIFHLCNLSFLGIIAFVVLICALLYTLLHWMLDRKLNLS